MTPALVFVGGFLGAGKTTLILRAARLLQDQGVRAAVITNDQDEFLVDSRLARAHNVPAGEVAGGCFCCRFSDMVAAADALAAYHPEVIFAEPVGSCVDLSATVLQPLKSSFGGRYRLAPLTVLIDPEMAARVYADRADPDMTFLYRNQVAEADLVCATKTDRPSAANPPVPTDFRVSALTGAGVPEWLDEVLHSRRIAGANLLDVDYARYAAAEAALAWLNLHADIYLSTPISPASIVGPLLEDLDRRLTESSITIAHLKVFDQSPSGYVKASLCPNGDEPTPEGDLAASPDLHHELVINLRAIADPETLLTIARHSLTAIRGAIQERHARAFRPPAPTPEHRIP